MTNKAELKIEERAHYLWITLPDAITMYDNKEIEEQIGSRLRDRKDQVVLDFSHTLAVYSSGLGLMIRIRRFVTERGGTLSLVNVSEQLATMFKALNIEKVFPIYSTDVEFEISQEDFGSGGEAERKMGFLCVTKIESCACRIHLSGEMTAGHDLGECSALQPIPDILLYLFDFSGLETIDSEGAEVLSETTKRIVAAGGVCRAYGIRDLTHEMLTLFGADAHFTFFTDEKSAYEGMSPVA
jgi:anti-anti-sigma factor